MNGIYVEDILNVCGGKLVFGDSNTICESFSKDTRTIERGDIYLGIKGEKFNGSNFYLDALEKGAKGCILQDVVIEKNVIARYKDRFVVIVEDVVKTIQRLAQYKRALYNIPVIGITGSVGKTSTKDMIASVLNEKYDVLKTEGNYNNEIGLPLTILKLKEENALVLEMGMSAKGEMSLLTSIARPTTAVITIIGSSHIGELGSRENILKAKLEILEGLEQGSAVIINNDNDLLNKWNSECKDDFKHITYGIENDSQYNAKNITLFEDNSSFEIEYQGKTYLIKVPVGGLHFVYNSLAAIAVGTEYDVKIEDIIRGIETFSLTKRRMETFKLNSNITVINDSYNASYESIKAALEYINAISNGRKIAVLGDVLELGDYSVKIHEEIGKEVIKNNVDILVTVGEEAKNINRVVRESDNNIKEYHFENNQEAINKLREVIRENDMILVKASNGMRFDEIVNGIKAD